MSHHRRLFVALALLALAAALVSGCSTVQVQAATLQLRDTAYDELPEGVQAQLDEAAYDDLRDAVDGTTISRDDVDREVEALADNAAFRDLVAEQGIDDLFVDGQPSSRLSAAVLNQLIQQELVDQELARRDVEPTDDELRDAEEIAADQFGDEEAFGDFPKWFRDEQIARIARFAALERVLEQPSAEPTEAELEQFYEANRQQIEACPSGKYVLHVLVPTQEAAAAARAEIVAGADFGDVAEAQSTDTQSAQAGGFLGCYTPGQFVAAFDAAAAAAAPGTITEPVETEFGWHVIRVTGTSFDDLRDVIRRQLEQQGQDATAGADLIEGLASELDPEIDPRYGSWVDDESGARVQAPSAPEVRDGRSTTTTAPGQLPGLDDLELEAPPEPPTGTGP